VVLSARKQAGTDQLDYGAMVGSNVSEALLCVRLAQGARRVQVVAAAAQQALPPQSAKPDACRCGGAAGDGAPAGGSGCAAEGGSAAQAWQLRLQPGQNLFNVTAVGGQRHTLAVVRLAERSHAALRALRVKGLDGTTTVLCGPPALGKGSAGGAGSASAVMRTKSSTAEAGTPERSAAAAPEAEDQPASAQLLNVLGWESCQPGAHRAGITQFPLPPTAAALF
jgi:hypothetical protein